MHDLKAREWACILPLIAVMVWMGIYAQSFLPSIGASNKTVLDRTQPTRVAEVANNGR